MHITLITGSQRAKGESTRIGHAIGKLVKADGHTATVLDLATAELPYWDEGMWGVEGLKDKWAKAWAPHAAELQKADAVVVVAPEYNGMVPSKLRNFLLLASTADWGHKPGLAVGVSSGVGGAYPIAELRAHGVKNSRLVWIPDHLIVRLAAHMLLDDTSKLTDEQKTFDAEARGRLRLSLNQLYAYADALKAARATGKLTDKAYPFAM